MEHLICECEEDWTDGTGICQNCGKERKMPNAEPFDDGKGKESKVRYELQCLLCGQRRNDLVVMQEHLMEVHQYTQRELMAQYHRHEHEQLDPYGEVEHIIYTMPDGKDWLKATVVR